MLPPALTTTQTSLICPLCGTVKSSGRSSCCGRGGSWFENCGSAGNVNFEHTWYEGIRVCNTGQHVAVGQQQYASHPQGNTSADDDVIGVDFKTVILAQPTFEPTSANTLQTEPAATPITVRDSRSMIPAGAIISGNTNINTQVNILTPKRARSPADRTRTRSIRNASAVISISTTSSSQFSSSPAINIREWVGVVYIVAYASVILIVGSW